MVERTQAEARAIAARLSDDAKAILVYISEIPEDLPNGATHSGDTVSLSKGALRAVFRAIGWSDARYDAATAQLVAEGVLMSKPPN